MANLWLPYFISFERYFILILFERQARHPWITTSRARPMTRKSINLGATEFWKSRSSEPAVRWSFGWSLVEILEPILKFLIKDFHWKKLFNMKNYESHLLSTIWRNNGTFKSWFDSFLNDLLNLRSPTETWSWLLSMFTIGCAWWKALEPFQRQSESLLDTQR